MEEQEKIRESFQSEECRRRIKRALRANIRRHRVENAIIGENVYYKRKGEKRWRGPGKVIGVDGKVVIVKHGALLRNVNKIHITRIKSIEQRELERDSEITEDEEEDSEVENETEEERDRKSTRLNSSHRSLSRMPSSA